MKYPGFATLSMVLIISAVLMVIVVTVSLLSVGEGQSALASELGGNDAYLVDGCVEDLLRKVHDNPSYAGTTITRPEGTCSISYTLSGPISWNVVVGESGTDFGRRVRVIFTCGQNITLTSWVEI
ncbi:hypothetical protein A2397_06235 [Candidatus Amesbacteria bacterium RIFOXYB1_FULL_44_23]|uniref:Type 4 fimbrial biogenesis protein PilX N-terminal domain-containing protein n=1 Tax=Candidatus Amesbacteria bacterium RIFOXYB1_FULL_44_23 TaxID=1797263 RepID=A0A1F4ZWW0_9BACT|nr:MAG: hypothetical protein A2397_06235 [Candidatus Amesbacteria bacterium RIFOXYB1_FULL_44_23]